MVWQLMLNGVPVGTPYDDGVPGGPDDPTFTTANVVAQVAASGGAANGYNFVGQSAGDPLES